MADVQYDQSVLEQHPPPSEAVLAVLRGMHWTPDTDVDESEEEVQAALQSMRLQLELTEAEIAWSKAARDAALARIRWTAAIDRLSEERRRNASAGSHPPDPAQQQTEEESRAALQTIRSQPTDAESALSDARRPVLENRRQSASEPGMADAEEEERRNDIAGSRPPGPAQQQPSETANQDNGFRTLARGALDNQRVFHPGGNGAINNTTTAAGHEQAIEERRVCHHCGADVDRNALIIPECGHTLCDECVAWRFRWACADAQQYPPRCCQISHIPLTEPVFQRLNEYIVERFRIRQEELDTPSEARTYCFNVFCQQYIAASPFPRKWAKCGFCWSATCTVCKKRGHWYKRLATEPDELAGDWGTALEWQKCPDCGQALRRWLSYCSFMDCPTCQCNFCYLCGQRWKSCDCPTTVFRKDDPGFLHPLTAAEDVQRPPCLHVKWWTISSPRQCDYCHAQSDGLKFVCNLCDIEVCTTCRQLVGHKEMEESQHESPGSP